jgi:hypothetical protein
MTVAWLRMFVASLSQRRYGFVSKTVHVRFLVDRVVMGQPFLSVFRFFPSASFHQRSIFIIYTLLLSEGQRDADWDHSNKQCSFGSRGALDKIKLLRRIWRVTYYSIFLFIYLFFCRPYLLNRCRLNVIWKRLMRDEMTTYIQRMRGADLFQRVMNSSAHSAILCIYTQIVGVAGGGRKWGVASGVQDCVSLCRTTMHISRNADPRENKHFDLTDSYYSPVLPCC